MQTGCGNPLKEGTADLPTEARIGVELLTYTWPQEREPCAAVMQVQSHKSENHRTVSLFGLVILLLLMCW